MVVAKEDQKYADRFREFINVICDMSIIGEKKLCQQCNDAIQLWEIESGLKFWEMFRLRGEKKEAEITRFLILFIGEIEERLYSEVDYDDIIETIELALRATFKNELLKVFPKEPDYSSINNEQKKMDESPRFYGFLPTNYSHIP